MKAFVLAIENYLLFDSTVATPPTKRIIGAFTPGKDGNYYRELLIGFTKEDGKHTMSFVSWWEWLKSSIERGDTLIDEEFYFDPKDVRIISFDIPINHKQKEAKMATRTFKRDFMLDVLSNDIENAKVIKDEIYENSRWSIRSELIFKFENKFYHTCYSRGATEQQDESPWEYDGEDIECLEVKPVETTTIEYVSVEK